MRNALEVMVEAVMKTKGHTKAIYIGVEEVDGKKAIEISAIGTSDSERIAIIGIAQAQMLAGALGLME